MPTTPRRLIAFSAQYGWPEEVATSDTVALPSVTLTGPFNASGQVMTGLTAPVNPSDAATKAYTDALSSGISACASVRALGATNIANLSGPQTVDGVSLVAGNRVLLTGQTGSNATQNGIWIVNTGAWTRPTAPPDYLTGTGAAGKFCFVEQGATYAKEGWLCTAAPGSDVIDASTTLTFVQFSGLGEVITANGLTSNLNTISVLLSGNPGLQFVTGALSVLPQPYGSLSLNADGLGVMLNGSTLRSNPSGLSVLGLPALFTIAGSAVDSNVTSAALNKLADGPTSLSDSLHNHQNVLSAQQVAANHPNGATALSAGDPVVWSSAGNQLSRADAVAYSSSGVIGIAAGNTAASATATIIKRGIAPGVMSGATPGAPVFLNVGGGLTQTYPTAAGAGIIQLGFCSNGSDLDVSISYVGRRASS